MITACSAWSMRRRRSSSAGKNEPCRSFADRELDIAAGGGEGLGAGAVAVGGAVLGAFVAAGAEGRGQLGLNQLLQA